MGSPPAAGDKSGFVFMKVPASPDFPAPGGPVEGGLIVPVRACWQWGRRSRQGPRVVWSVNKLSVPCPGGPAITLLHVRDVLDRSCFAIPLSLHRRQRTIKGSHFIVVWLRSFVCIQCAFIFQKQPWWVTALNHQALTRDQCQMLLNHVSRELKLAMFSPKVHHKL